MKDYVVRMVDELNELQTKAEKLNIFIEQNDIYKSLPQEKQDLMRDQWHAMCLYIDILKKRIALEEE